jgi:hypothetical protein
MAILKKRRSQANLPSVTTDRVSRPGDKLTSTVNESPDVGRPNRPAGGDLGTTRPLLTSRTTAGGTPASRLTSAVKGEAVSTPKIGGGSTVTPAKTATQKTTAKPVLTSVIGSPKTITNKVTGTSRPSVSTSQGKTKSTSGLTNAITGALSGAAIGVGTKAVYDKLTGTTKIVDAKKVPGGTTTTKPGSTTVTKPGSTTVTKPGSTTVTKPGGTTTTKPGGTTTTKPGGTTTTKPGGTTVTKPGGTTTTKPGGTTTTKPGGTTTTKPGGTPTKPGGPTKPTTGGPKAPVTPKGPTKPGGTTTKPGGTDGTKPGTGASGFPVGVNPNATANEDGTYTETFDDGSTITYDADGNVIGSTEATGDGSYTETFDDGSTVTYDADGNIISTTDAEGTDIITNDDGTTTYTYDDGSTVTLDDDGNVVSYTEATDEYAEDSTDIKTDDEGNTVYTYDDGSTVTIDSEGNVIDSSDATDFVEDESDYEDEVVLEEGATDEELEELGYYEDEYGNIYDSSGELVYSADDYYTDEEIADYIYTDDYGNQYDFYGNLVAEADHSDYVYTDDDGYQYDWDGNVIFDPYAGSEDEYYYDEEITYPEDEYAEDEYTEDEYDYGDPDYFGKKGGLVALMKDGGVPHFEDGGEVEYFDDGSYIVYYDDGSYITYDDAGEIYGVTGEDDSAASIALDEMQMRSTSVEPESNDENTQYFDDGSSITYDEDGNVVSYTDATDGETVSEDNRYSAGNIQYFDDGSYIQTFDDGSTLTVDSDGNVVGSTEAPDYSVTSGGSGVDLRDYYNTETPANRARRLADEANREKSQKSAIDELMSSITGSGYLGAGAAGAVLGALLGNSDLFSGGTGTQNQGIDMSKVGVIPARTTEFGVGPANYVTYDQYAARDEMPEIYGDELYRNLNAPGFNPVNEGDYGYDETERTDEESTQQTQGMADGGLAGGYYTFGKAVDPISNLTNPRPAQQTQAPQMAQAGGLPRSGGLPNSPAMGTPQQPSAQQQMPQQVQMPPAMKRGGLPVVSNVPLAQGRLDFRKGSAVHGPGDGQSDDIPAMLADGEYVIDAETVAQIGNGSTKAGAKALDDFRQNIRKHKRSAPLDKIPPKTKALTSYLKKGI